jgi:hypothetical protein
MMQRRPLLLWFIAIILWGPLISLVAGPSFFISLYPLLAYVVLVLVITFLAVAHTIRQLRRPRA